MSDEPTTGSASIVIAADAATVYDALADVTAMGDYSPENTGARWVDGATGPAVGARFEGDNIAKVGPITLKKWTTVSEVTVAEPGVAFAFDVEGNTTWRFDLEAVDGGTRVTESFSHPPFGRWQRMMYNIAGDRRKAMIAGMQRTLEQLKTHLEA